MIKKTVIFFIFLMLLSTSVFSLTDYNETGTPSGHFRTGTGFFNTELEVVETATRAITDSRQTPLVTDLDNDGVNEIIVLDGANIRLYQNTSLDILDAYSLGSVFSEERYSNMITYDVDGDGFKEILIVLEETNRLEIINFTGAGNFVLQNVLNVSDLNHQTGETMIKCGGVDNCLMVYSTHLADVGGDNYIYAVGFNKTDFGASGGALLSNQDADEVYCMPRVRNIQYVDHDNDNNFSYIYSYIRPNQVVYIDWVIRNVDNTVTLQKQNSISGIISTAPSQSDCEGGNHGRYFTAPLTFDIDGSPSNGDETVVGFMVDADEFNMRSFDSSGNDLDDYPEILDADGTIISNVFRANTFTDTDDVDFCVFGYAQDQDELDLLCASEQTGQLVETDEFVFDNEGRYNISFAYGDPWIVTTHSGQHSTVTTDGNNLDEIINSHGVFTLDYVGLNELVLIYDNEQTDGAVVPVDYENSGREDFLVLTDTNLWYVDDGFTNLGANISSYYVNPCLDSTWKSNTSVEVRITVTDRELDLVNARAILYQGESFEQDSNWTANLSSGTTSSFSFQANQTTGLSTLRLMARDNNDPSLTDSIDLSFSVGATGVEFGDCTTEREVGAVVDNATNATLEPDLNANIVTQNVNQIGNLTGLGATLIYLIMMVVVAVCIWVYGDGPSNPQMIGGVVGFVELILLIIGVKLDLISYGILLVIVVGAVAYIANILRKESTGA